MGSAGSVFLRSSTGTQDVRYEQTLLCCTHLDNAESNHGTGGKSNVVVSVARFYTSSKAVSVHFTRGSGWPRYAAFALQTCSHSYSRLQRLFDPVNNVAWKSLAVVFIEPASGLYRMGLGIFAASTRKAGYRNKARTPPYYRNLLRLWLRYDGGVILDLQSIMKMLCWSPCEEMFIFRMPRIDHCITL